MHSTHWTQIFELSLEKKLQKSINIETDSMLWAVLEFKIIHSLLATKIWFLSNWKSYKHLFSWVKKWKGLSPTCWTVTYYILPIKLNKLSHVQPIVLFEQCVNLGSHSKQLPAQKTSEKSSTLEHMVIAATV